MSKNKTHYQDGTQVNIAIVFSCPGKEEEKENRPAIGQTGKNLESLLEILAESEEIFENIKKDDLRITNSWDQVEYQEKTERTEANYDEILQKENLDRLYEDVNEIEELIICSGERAEVAILALIYANKISSKIKIIKIRHLGLRGLNQIKYDENEKEIKSVKGDRGIEKENTRKRLKVIAKEVLEQLKGE